AARGVSAHNSVGERWRVCARSVSAHKSVAKRGLVCAGGVSAHKSVAKRGLVCAGEPQLPSLLVIRKTGQARDASTAEFTCDPKNWAGKRRLNYRTYLRS